MKFKDIVELSFQRFRTRSMRFLLTVLGVGIGIGVVFFLVSLGFGLQDVVIGRIATSESLLALDVASSEDAEKILPITEETINQFKSIDHVTDVSPLLSSPAEITYGSLKAQTLSQAVVPSYFRYSALEPERGTFFGDNERRSIVVTEPVLRLFELSPEDAVGKEVNITFFLQKQAQTEEKKEQQSEGDKVVKINAPQKSATTEEDSVNVVAIPEPFKIVGVIQSDTNSMYVPLLALENVENHTYAQTKVRIDSKDNIEIVRRDLLAKGYTVRALTDTLDQLNKVFRITQLSLGTLGIIALFIASVGMFNTLTISLLERTREVGILKTIGATKRDVWMIFLFEALLIGVFGGLAGVLGGLGFAKFVNILVNILAQRFGGDPVKIFLIPWWFVVSILSVSIVVGLLTGLYPAQRAAKLNPLKALRHE